LAGPKGVIQVDDLAALLANVRVGQWAGASVGCSDAWAMKWAAEKVALSANARVVYSVGRSVDDLAALTVGVLEFLKVALLVEKKVAPMGLIWVDARVGLLAASKVVCSDKR